MSHRPDDLATRPLPGTLAQFGLHDLPLDLIAPDPATTADPLYDGRRLASIDALGASDPAQVQPLVSDILAEVAERLDAPIALLNVVLTGSQVIAGEHGLSGWLAEVRATPVEWSLCARIVRTGAGYVVPDWGQDEATSGNPLLTVDGLRAYAGAPLRSPSGDVLGAVCVLDTTARDFDADALHVLAEAAGAAMDRLVQAAATRQDPTRD